MSILYIVGTCGFATVLFFGRLTNKDLRKAESIIIDVFCLKIDTGRENPNAIIFADYVIEGRCN